MKKLHRITEAEVMADFLKGEFFQREYNADREQFAPIVNHPDLSNETENALRRALLFRRRDTMWWELPEDRQWWEVEFEPADVERVSVFPRAHCESWPGETSRRSTWPNRRAAASKPPSRTRSPPRWLLFAPA